MAVEIKKIILRQGTEVERKQVTLDQGEPGFCSDSNRLYIGTGTGSGVPVGTNNLGFTTFTGSNTNISTNLAPVSGDFVFDTSSNLMYMLTGTDYTNTSAFAPFGSQFTVDNNTLVLIGNQVQVANNSILPTKFFSGSIGAGLERTSSNTVLKTKLGSSITYDGGGGMIVANGVLTNSNFANTPANTVKGRLNSLGPLQDLSVSDLATLLAGVFTTVPIGTVIDWAGTSASVPATYLECNGQAVSRTTYASLFATLSTTWGGGDGSTTFNVPDLRRRTTVGSGGVSTATLLNSVGSVGGSETHVLSANEGKCQFDLDATFVAAGSPLPANTFVAGMQLRNRGNIDFNVSPFAPAGTTQSGTIGASPADAHNNLQPSAVVRKIIKATS
jgi:microcystin-dependent protein